MMKQKINQFFCVSFILLLVTTVLPFRQLKAQTDFTVGSGTTGNTATSFPSPLPGNKEGSRSQYLFLASELQAAGLTRGYITGLKVNVLALNNCGILQQYSIKMGATAKATLGTAWEPTPAQFYTNAALSPVAGINTFTFSDKFFWNGTSNILIEICVNGGSRFLQLETFNPTVAWTTGLPFNASHTYGANDITSFCTTTTTTELGTATTRPNLTFTWQVAPPDCSGAPSAGTANSTKTIACPEEPFFLSRTGTEAMGLAYQWQSSADGNTWQNIAGAAKDTLTTSLISNTYYRLMVTCVASNQSAPSSSVLVSKTPGVSGTFTIDNSLTTPGAGQFKTFTDAYNYIKCGIGGPVVFNVVNTGTPYNEQLVMNKVYGTSTTNTITFNGNGATINYLSSNTNERAVIKMNGTSHVIFNNLRITALGTTSSQYGYGVHLMNNADSNTVKNCIIDVNSATTSSFYNGIVISGGSGPTAYGSYCDGNVLESNSINGGVYGISIVGGTPGYEDYPVSNNKIINNTIKNFYTYGIYLTNTALTTIDGNDLSRPDRTATPSAVYGIYLSQANMASAITRNRIHAFFDGHLENAAIVFYGIGHSNADSEAGFEHLVANNIIYDIKGLGTIYALYNMGSNMVNYYHNTISLDDRASTALTPAYGFYTSSNVGSVNVIDNIFFITRGGAGLKYAVYFADNDYSLFTLNYNNFFFDANPTVLYGYSKGVEYATLADWRTGTGFDAASLMVDPAFKDAASGNFTPTSAAFDGKGKALAEVTVDYYKTARNTTTPDIGAVEFSLPSCNTSFLPGQSFANVGTTACVSKEVLLNLKNNDVGLGMTYQWQSATDLSGTWTNISDPLVAPPLRFTTTNNTLYYRAAVSCNGGTPAYSDPVKITIGGLFPGGTYTIDKTQPTDPAGTRNFSSFADVEKAISCGITSAVVFNVKAGTYSEQVRFAAIPNSSETNSITFRSETGNAADAIVTFNAQSVPLNYTLRLDSASHFRFLNMTIASENATYGRTFDILNLASDIRIEGCIIKAALPSATAYATYGADQTTVAGIHAATGFKGNALVIKNNKFQRGAKGIYIVGTASRPSEKDSIVNNSFDSCYHHTIYVQHTKGIKIQNNTVPVKTAYKAASFNQGVYAIYTNNCDGDFELSGNNISLQDNTGYIYGIYMTGNDGTATARGKIRNNTVMARNGLTSLVTGLYNESATYLDIINNEISVHSTIAGTSNSVYATGIYTGNAAFTNYYNNSILNTSPAAGIYNTAFWVNHQYANSGSFTNVFNNIFANTGGGPAVFYNYTAEHINSDYNLLYTSGALLVKQGPTNGAFEKNFANLPAWQAQYGTEMNSIVYQPAYTSNTDLRPAAANDGSWALQGRGMQLEGNASDKLGNTRSVTLTGGVPDLGAYEFFPSVAPPALTAIPAAPAAGTRQVFMMGTDTVTAITWGASVPAAITLKRYSGVLPAGLAASEKSLYYYVDAATTGAGSYNYSVEQFFIDPWLYTLPIKSQIKLGRTNAAAVWTAGVNSIIDSLGNKISEADLAFAGKFTGMTDGKEPVRPVVTTPSDSSTRGTRFWAPYGLTRDQYQGNGQNFRFILAADETTQVTVSVNGTNYKKSYTVPAGKILTTDAIPKSGAYDARLRGEGLFSRGVLIESDKPIAATAFMELEANYSLLMPAGTYGKAYTTLGARQFSGYGNMTMGKAWVNVVADRDSTIVEITPSNNTEGGRQAGVPFRVTLQRGQVYQLIGAYIRSYTQAETGGTYNELTYASYELTGTKIVSVPNESGNCQPIAVFSGSSGTGIRCEPILHGADQSLYQQAYPSQAWGTRYLTTPLASKNSQNEFLFNIFRVMVKDPATVVKRNGVVMTGIKGNYYEFSTREPQYIEADKPVMVGQFTTYFTACGNDEYSNPGSNEGMHYLTPLGYGVKDILSYVRKSSSTYETIINYVTAVVPEAAFASLKIEGVHSFDTSYTHPQLAGYKVAMKRYNNVDSVIRITCDQPFTALVHAPHNVQGFVYNAGFQVPPVDFTNESYRNTYSQLPEANTYTCVNAPFKPKVYLPVMASSLTWKLSAATGITPSGDVVVNTPVPVDTIVSDNRIFYGYLLANEIRFTQAGNFIIPVQAVYSEDAATCSKLVEGSITINVIAAPVVDYTTNYTGCINFTGNFEGNGTAGNGAVLNRWSWNFGDNTTASDKTTSKKWNTAGNYTVTLTAIANDGCIGNVGKQFTVKELPVLEVVNNNIGTCPGSAVTFQIKNPASDVVYTWYDRVTGGTLLATGTSYTVTNPTAATQYYASANRGGCDIAARVPAGLYIIPNVAAPAVTVDTAGVRMVRFKWNAVANATGYQVSADNGATWTTPSSGANGTTHTISGLQPSQTVTLLVRGLGGCELLTSPVATATTYTDNIFIPNSFTPNGDAVNDVFRIYGNEIRSLRLMIFNQWGQKVFETSNKEEGWDGRKNGALQPSGVYIYVCQMTMLSGEEMTKKGSINLVR
ncbi:T9SS type B sorting domain-containing protein [Filimonas effusa]|uniref:T9SS type B sorting domain-containing protein n=1 Tax=Filimonas effusa TaxID=2508721 RepID=A0A4Q1D344_9BACT|nr:gliding motility-associated C-terminal domain-containing protein [Filimonas effusa]RXK82820.1 T9SS type B sorting domain-containing protein [Filimonas effusa]